MPPPGGPYQAHPSLTGRPRLPSATLEELRAAAAGKRLGARIALVYVLIPLLLFVAGAAVSPPGGGFWPLVPAGVALVVGHVWSAFLVREMLVKLDPLWRSSARWATPGLVMGLLLPVTAVWFAAIVDMLSGMYFKERKFKPRIAGPKDAELVAWAAANPVAPQAPPVPFQ
ncbi:MAG: hypothetical protein KF857_08760 [Fimbriimonadaceae bacterium]|nr:hypothetical protein [Fimbriimonadaceae bacterium]